MLIIYAHFGRTLIALILGFPFSKMVSLILTFQHRQAYVNKIFYFFLLKYFQMLNRKSFTSKIQTNFCYNKTASTTAHLLICVVDANDR